MNFPLKELPEETILPGNAEYICRFAIEVKGAPIDKLAEAFRSISIDKLAEAFRNMNIEETEHPKLRTRKK